MVILQTDVALWRAIRGLELADLLTIEAHGDGRTIGLNLKRVPLADRRRGI